MLCRRLLRRHGAHVTFLAFLACVSAAPLMMMDLVQATQHSSRCWSYAARCRRRERALRLGYISSHPGKKFIAVDEHLATVIQRMVDGRLPHMRLNEATGLTASGTRLRLAP